MPDTIHALLTASESPAIGAPDRPWLSHAALHALAHRTVVALNGFGIGRGDRVAIVLPNGPEAATAFLCIACGATTAPLNPAYTLEEFLFYLKDLRARALVVLDGAETPARAAADSLGVPIVSLLPAANAGDFSLRLESPIVGAASHPGWAAAEDIALVLHTSGTTSRPKIVPLRHVNVATSAKNIGRSLALSPDDVGLNIMPLFHIHGLIAAVLAAVAAGGAVCCTPGFNAFRFFGWLGAVRPTWISAVPTMFQALLPYAERNRAAISGGRLRLLRTSSASLPAPVMGELEAAFGVPVIESYGMTEAAHQMASNPLPPAPRFPGSVGIAAGPEIAIMDASSETLLPIGEPGEVVIRGRNVTAGYEANPEANAKAFVAGWFRTGDEGFLDSAGYLRLTGRLKEIIVRGGEKVSPLEVDAVLLAHASVAQALTFAMPHPKLGEEVAAAIVLQVGVVADEAGLRAFCAERLAAFKVPRKFLFVDEIPKGATGKLQRIGLAARLGVTA